MHGLCFLLIAKKGEKRCSGSDKGMSPGETVVEKGSWVRVAQGPTRVAR